MFQVDAVYKNGTIYTMDPELPKAQAVAVTGNIIAGVGSDTDMEAVIGPGTKVYDLGGKTVIPGFNDSHNHMITLGILKIGVPILPEQCPDIAKMKLEIAEKAVALEPGEWIYGRGYDESRMEGGIMPDAKDLDEVAPDNPVFLTRTCGHISVANSLALKLAKIDDSTKDPSGGKIVRDEHGKATGFLQETAQSLIKNIMPPYGKEDIVKALDQTCKIYNSFGITSSNDCGTSAVIEEEVEGWAEAGYLDMLTVRTSNYLYANSVDRLIDAGLLHGAYGNSKHRFAGVKFILDGGIGGSTAAVSEPYLTPPYQRGILYMEQEELDAHVKKFHDLGVQMSIHGIGERTIDQLLNSYEKALKANPKPGHRHRVEHASLADDKQLKRMKDLNLYVNMQPGFFYFLGDSHLNTIGYERVKNEFPINTALNMGIMTAIGTDCPVIDGNPKYTLYSTVFRKTISGQSCGTAEAISMEKAIWAYTQAGACFTFEEKIKGSITAGKLADFIVLSLDPMKIDTDHAQDVLDMSVEATIMDGKLVYGGI